MTLKLTAVLFIRSITTVIVCVTEPVPWDTAVIVTGIGGFRAGSRWPGGAVLFIAAIHTVIVSVTAPVSRDTLSSVDTGECPRGTGVICKSSQPVIGTSVFTACRILQNYKQLSAFADKETDFERFGNLPKIPNLYSC